jgi:hypothetical protein
MISVSISAIVSVEFFVLFRLYSWSPIIAWLEPKQQLPKMPRHSSKSWLAIASILYFATFVQLFVFGLIRLELWPYSQI